MRERSWLWGLGALIVVLGLAFGLGAANPVKPAPISTDALGPDPGEPAAQYLARAAQTVADADADAQSGPAEPRWALVSFDAAATTPAVAAALGPIRISQALFVSPAAGAQSPLVAVDTPAGVDAAALLANAQLEAAGRLESDPAAAALDGARATAAADLRGGCACVVGVLVRGTPTELRGLAGQQGVRGVEALPADAVFGRFAVRVLLPGQ